MNPGWRIETSPLGRVLVAPAVTEGAALFYTTSEFKGRLDEDTVDAIRDFISQRFAIDARLATCSQVHGVRVQRVNGERPWCEFNECDAIFTTERNVALGIKVADCLPVSLLDSSHGVAANVHSGWRGASADILGQTLAQLIDHTPFQPDSASAWLGPSIRSCCFEVGEEVIDRFAEQHGDIEPFVDRSRGPKPFLDLPEFAKTVLMLAGIPRNRIYDSGICTRCGVGFHSYRRERDSGRNLAIVARS